MILRFAGRRLTIGEVERLACVPSYELAVEAKLRRHEWAKRAKHALEVAGDALLDDPQRWDMAILALADVAPLSEALSLLFRRNPRQEDRRRAASEKERHFWLHSARGRLMKALGSFKNQQYDGDHDRTHRLAQLVRACQVERVDFTDCVHAERVRAVQLSPPARVTLDPARGPVLDNGTTEIVAQFDRELARVVGCRVEDLYPRARIGYGNSPLAQAMRAMREVDIAQRAADYFSPFNRDPREDQR